MNEVIKLLQDRGIPCEENISLKQKTWIKTGGIVKLWITPLSSDQLVDCLQTLTSYSVDYELVGHTSNLYYLDTYNPSCIISTVKIRQFCEKEDYIEVSCGTPVTVLSKYCVDKGYVGYAGLINLPGTVGGALCNNSDCFDCSISQHLIDAVFYDNNSNSLRVLTSQDFKYTYRNSSLKKHELKGVIVSARLEKTIGNVDEEKKKADYASKIRKETQEPAAFTLGSVYAGLTAKRDVKSLIIQVGGGKLLRISKLYTKPRYIKLLLILYGYSDLSEYVSNKVINTFKWLPGRNTFDKFKRYQDFISKAFQSPRLEIEIRDGK